MCHCEDDVSPTKQSPSGNTDIRIYILREGMLRRYGVYTE